jgi:hypothetical protein
MSHAIDWCIPPLVVPLGSHVQGETGAKFIIREDGRRINLAFLKAGQDRRLELGDKVGVSGCMITRCGRVAASPVLERYRRHSCDIATSATLWK